MKAVRIFLLTIFTIAALAYLNLILIPKPQQTQAAWLRGTQQYACGPSLTVELIPNSETCNGSNNGNISSYQSSILVKAADGSQGAYAVHWKWNSYWCSNEDPHAPCLNNLLTSNEQVGGLTGDNKAFVTASSPVNRPSGQFAGLACGYYQNDFAFYVTNNDHPNTVICGISLDNPGDTNNNASWCHTGVTCTVPTPTSTPTQTPTPTSTPTPTVTPSITPSVTPTVTPTQAVTPTPTPQPTTIIINVHQEQQQQQQIVLAATVAPAPSTSKLPSTGGEGVAAIATLLSLLPVGLKLRKLI